MAILKKGSKLETDLIATEKYVDSEVTEKVTTAEANTDSKISEMKGNLESTFNTSLSSKLDKEGGTLTKGKVVDSVFSGGRLENFFEIIYTNYLTGSDATTVFLTNRNTGIHYLSMNTSKGKNVKIQVSSNDSIISTSKTYTFLVEASRIDNLQNKIELDPKIKWLNGVVPSIEDFDGKLGTLFFIITGIGNNLWYGSHGGVFIDVVE